MTVPIEQLAIIPTLSDGLKKTFPDEIGGMGRGVLNVKDYGATGDGSTDDQPFIQAAVDALGVDSGMVYFPPGDYRVNSSISLDNTGDNKSIVLMGCGNASHIIGSLSGFIIDKASTQGGGSQYIRKISQLFVENSSAAAGSGCIRLEGSWPAIVRDCYMNGNIGFTCSENSAVDIANCKLSGLGNDSGGTGYGIAVTGECTVYKCDVVGFALDGIRACGAAGSIIGCRVEVCAGAAIYLGKKANGSADSAQGWFVGGNSLEGNGEGIHFRSVLASLISGNLIHGEDGNGSISGFHMEGNCSYTTVSNLASYGDFGVTSVSTGTVTGHAGGDTALLTITVAPTYGSLAVGQLVYMGGTFYGSIGSLGSGSGGTGTYNLINNTNPPGNHTSSGQVLTTGVTSAFSAAQIEAPLTGCVFEGVNAYVVTSGHGVGWDVDDGNGAQFRSCNFTPTTQTLANAPTATALDGDLWTFTNSIDTVLNSSNPLNVDILAAGSSTSRVVGRYNATTGKWYPVARG